MKIILQKAIASSGYCSRRKAESLIREGKVEVNGAEAIIGDMVDLKEDEIKISGQLIGEAEEFVYIKLNKPVGYVCTSRKFSGEKNIFDLIQISERLYPVGRLDKNSRGLVLLTNDGDLAQKLSHPKFEHEKVYHIRLKPGAFFDGRVVAEKLEKGVDIGEGEGIARAKKAQYLQNRDFIITLSEGKKRQIRRMFAAFRLDIDDLLRVEIAGLKLDNLKEAAFQHLSDRELADLKKKLNRK